MTPEQVIEVVATARARYRAEVVKRAQRRPDGGQSVIDLTDQMMEGFQAFIADEIRLMSGRN